MDFSKSVESTLFEAAAGLADPEERRVFLEQTCQGDPARRSRLESLLALQARSEDFFNLPPAKMPAAVARIALLEGDEETAQEPGETLLPPNGYIAQYRLGKRLGEGGLGIVYLAEQLEPVHRQVALKIIRLGLDTEKVIARFDLERRALAMMDHPNIARVLDAGSTASGRPFFVMELVEGERITDFCHSEKLPIRQRLELFVQVCQAIQHAHQKGVIHRDIKPSNVLVRRQDGVPTPKVIDFGIAKATANSLGEDSTFTAHDQCLGTPAYMSPEQAAGGGDVDTRSDVYGLGALLYELVAGRPPFDSQRLRNAGIDEMRRILREEEPVPPSTIAHSLAKSDDLNWIVLKAMAKERHRRYDTANGLGADVRRFLHDEPVSARPPSRRYQLVKLVRRNKVLFTGVAIALLGLTTGLAVSTRLLLLERASREEQSRLRGIAEASLANEAKLREAGGFRERVSQAAVMISYRDLAKADQLLAAIPVERTPSSLEAADSFRKVADWHLFAGRWDDAARRYASLARAIATADSSDHDNVSRNLLPAAAALCLTDPGSYDQLRELAVDRFSESSHPVVAEQVLKTCLLRPADPESRRRLRPLAGIVATAVDAGDGIMFRDPYMRAWGCFAVALMEFRDGNDVQALTWANRSVASPNESPVRLASTRIVAAMIERRGGGPRMRACFSIWPLFR